jgi:HlyD family secretion protein
MLKRSKIILGSVAATVAVSVGIGVFVATRQNISYETEAISRGTVVEEVSVTGSIAPSKKISLQPEVGGKVSVIAVKEGDEVKAGDTLVQLDVKDVQAKVAAQRAAVDAARARLAELSAGATRTELTVSASAVETAQSRLDAAVASKADAQVSLDNAQKSRDNAKAKAAAQIDSKIAFALTDFDDAVTKANDAITRLSDDLFTSDDRLAFSTSSSQFESDAVSTRSVAKAALPDLGSAVSSAKSAGTASAVLAASTTVIAKLNVVKAHLDADAKVLDSAINLSSATLSTYRSNVSVGQNNLTLSIQTISSDKSSIELQQKLNDADITSSEIAVSNAQAALSTATHGVETAKKALEQAEAELALREAGSRPEVIAAQRAQVASQEAALSGLLTDMAKRTIVAPLDSIVTKIDAEAGETVQPSQVVVSLNARDKFEIVANISEVDISRIAVGQTVVITLDAFATSEKWSGKVVTVNPAEKVVEGVIFYETKMLFDQEDARLKSGMTANLDIETDRRENALRVPLRALRTKPGRTYVEVRAGGKVAERDVKIGIENSQYAEVLEGLSEGEDVVVSSTEKK